MNAINVLHAARGNDESNPTHHLFSLVISLHYQHIEIKFQSPIASNKYGFTIETVCLQIKQYWYDFFYPKPNRQATAQCKQWQINSNHATSKSNIENTAEEFL
ncbi:hypothetical protein HPP92_011431 [Vanilla planifolia]|uniref:Uncharacterized protein n=1 Tax=Vanilla planifolia TaxID=51239 RepID=A0A835R611_VANPL|nr:hypothetical protein HPP92_011431 [Vanilla planifolia]